MIENFCYTFGDRNRVFDTPLGRIGIVMCWEQLRYETVRDMAKGVDFLVGGSAWWSFTTKDGAFLKLVLDKENRYLSHLLLSLPESLTVRSRKPSSTSLFPFRKSIGFFTYPHQCEEALNS